jgi:hypothetical protein
LLGLRHGLPQVFQHRQFAPARLDGDAALGWQSLQQVIKFFAMSMLPICCG